jgi:hypothetical protein
VDWKGALRDFKGVRTAHKGREGTMNYYYTYISTMFN